MGAINNNMQDLGNHLFESVAAEKFLREADLPHDLNLVDVSDDGLSYAFTFEGTEYVLLWLTNAMLIREATEDLEDYTQLVHIRPEEEDTDAEGFETPADAARNIAEYLEAASRFKKLQELDFVQAHPEAFSRSFASNGVILTSDEMRIEMRFNKEGYAAFVRSVDDSAADVYDIEEFESPLDVPLFHTSPVIVHGVMAAAFMHYMAHEVGLEREGDLIGPLMEVLAA